MRSERRWDWTLVLQSALLCAFAFNLIFFIQELFLVVPKALTPGLRPTLFHNNHHWTGGQLATPGGRSRVMFRIATLPAVAALLLVIPFRVPGTADQVFLAPLIMITAGIACLQGVAGFVAIRSATWDNVRSRGAWLSSSTLWPLAALLIQLAIFQLVLRHGIDFF